MKPSQAMNRGVHEFAIDELITPFYVRQKPDPEHNRRLGVSLNGWRERLKQALSTRTDEIEAEEEED
jgi:hypothetical protein